MDDMIASPVAGIKPERLFEPLRSLPVLIQYNPVIRRL